MCKLDSLIPNVAGSILLFGDSSWSRDSQLCAVDLENTQLPLVPASMCITRFGATLGMPRELMPACDLVSPSPLMLDVEPAFRRQDAPGCARAPNTSDFFRGLSSSIPGKISWEPNEVMISIWWMLMDGDIQCDLILHIHHGIYHLSHIPKNNEFVSIDDIPFIIVSQHYHHLRCYLMLPQMIAGLAHALIPESSMNPRVLGPSASYPD